MQPIPPPVGVAADGCAQIVNLSKEDTPLRPLTTFPPGPLALSTVSALRSSFVLKGHQPSPGMWASLTQVAAAIEAMAEGRCDPVVYLSSLDPGVGKTQTVVHGVRTLLGSEDHREVGVLLVIGRIDGIRALVEELELREDDFAVFTSDKSLDDLGLGINNVDAARVILTTHSMVEARCRGRAFGDVSELFFQGRPRAVRIWDEAIQPGRPLTLRRDRIAPLIGPLRSRYPRVADALDDLFVLSKTTEDRGRLVVPNFEADFGCSLKMVEEAIGDTQSALIDDATVLWALAGKTATVRKDGTRGHTMLDYEDVLPRDFMPLLVLDASGRVRATYEQWRKGRQTLVRLEAAPKRYNALKVHVWKRGGGKGSLVLHQQTIADGVASTINTKPDEEWLIVHHKGDSTFDFQSQVTDLLKPRTAKVHFVNWGRHDATNAFCNVGNVILAGTLFYPASHYEALGRLSSAFPSSAGQYPEAGYEQIVLGEHKHLILQAACRGRVRRCIGDVCGPCNLYIIASGRSGIIGALGDVFPGCHVAPWQPIRKALKGKVAEAVTFMERWFEAQPDGHLRASEVRLALGMTAPNFNRAIRSHQDFKDAMAERWIIERGLGRLPGFMRVSFEENLLAA
jgi:hypothetical protein